MGQLVVAGAAVQPFVPAVDGKQQVDDLQPHIRIKLFAGEEHREDGYEHWLQPEQHANPARRDLAGAINSKHLIHDIASDSGEQNAALGRANITVNKNAVPNDPRSPFVTSGVRIGTPAVTTRGFGAAEVTTVAGWIADILEDAADPKRSERVRGEVLELCRKFPVYG